MNKKIAIYVVGGILILAVLTMLVWGIEGIYRATQNTECWKTIRYTNTTSPAIAYVGETCNINVTNQTNFVSVDYASMTDKGNGFYQYNCSALSNGDYMALIECNSSGGDYNYVTLEFVIGDETSYILTNGSAYLNETQIEKAVWYNDNYAHTCNNAP